MRGIFQAFVVITLALLLSFGGPPAAATGKACDKACLADITERYLEAKIRGTPEHLPLASNLRVTSNSRVVKAGQGPTWQPGITIVNRHTFLDPVTRTSVFFGTIAGRPAEQRLWWHYAVRLTLDGDNNLFEIEEQSIVEGFQTADKVEVPFKEAAIFDSVLPEDERVGATALIDVANGYWDALTRGTQEGPLFAPDCQRTEFGAYSTNNPYTHDQRGKPDFVPEAKTGKSCRLFFDAGGKFRWTTDNRRFYVIDEARGVVVGIGQLHRFGKNGHPGLTLIEAFKVVNGKIEFLWAPAFNWGLEDSGWPDWERPQY